MTAVSSPEIACERRASGTGRASPTRAPRARHCAFGVATVLLLVVADVVAADMRSELRISPNGHTGRSVSRALGSRVVFTCELVQLHSNSTSGSSNRRRDTPLSTTLQWFDKNDVMIKEHDGSSTSSMYTDRTSPSISKLYIPETQNRHAGPYTCVQMRGNERLLQKIVKLDLFKDIQFENVHSEVLASVGGNVTLPCRPSAEPPPDVTWRFENNVIHKGGRFDVQSDGLHINNITSSDQGSYYCQAQVKNSGLFKEFKMVLNLLESPSYRHAEERLMKIEGHEGESVSIWCNATGSPPITYEFFKDGQRLQPDDKNLVLDSHTGELTIKQLRARDNGKYMCMASNQLGGVTSERKLEVHIVPDIYEYHSVIESRGMTATLLCRSRGRPAPNVTFRRLTPDGKESAIYRIGWRNENDRIKVHEVIPGRGVFQLIINYVTVADAGNYSCESRNSVGVDTEVAEIDVGYSPSFVGHQRQLIYAWPGSESRHNLTCAVDARPDAVLTWQHHGHLLDHNNATFHIFAISPSLSVLQISIPDADAYTDINWIFGSYACQAANYFGRKHLHIDVHKAEVPGEPLSVTVEQSLTNSIRLSVEPPPYTGGLEVTEYEVRNEHHINRFKLGEEILVNGLRPSTVYLLRVSAVNAVGVGSPVQLAVTTADLRAPSAVRVTSVKSTGNPSEYVITWDEPYDGGMPLRKYQLRYRRVTAAGGAKSTRTWLPVDTWTNISIAVTEPPSPVVEYALRDLLPHSYYELQVRAANDLDWSPSNATPYVMFTARGRHQPMRTASTTTNR